MTDLARGIKRTAKQSASINATIVDVFGEAASVKLTNNGALMRNLKVIGGPVKTGQLVEVNFSSSPPTITAYSTSGITIEETEKIVDTSRTPFMTPTVNTLRIYHNGTWIADASALNFVDGT